MSAVLVGAPGATAKSINPASSGVFYCADICKYHQGKVEYSSTKINYVSWWGSTASGSCDPSNDVVKWRLQGVSVFNDYTDVKLYGWGPQSWQTNCQIVYDENPPWAWSLYTGINRPSDASSHYWWQFYSSGSGGYYWTGYLRLDF